MTLSVEDGTGKSDADSYIDVAFADSYLASVGKTSWATGDTSAKETALRVATAYIDSVYGRNFPGFTLKGRAQALQWPRSGAVVDDLYAIDVNEVPREVKKATAEAAFREFMKSGSLSPDLKSGGAIKSVTADSVEVVFTDGYTGQLVFQSIDQVLGSLIGSSSSSQYVGRVERA